MKICPNCGAENEHDALTCILCEFEFDVDDSSSDEYDNDITDENSESESDIVSTVTNDTIDSKNEHENDFENAASSNRNSKAIIIALISIIVITGGIAGGAFLMKNKGSQESVSSNISGSNISTQDSMNSNNAEITKENESAVISQTTFENNTTEATLSKEKTTELTIEKLDTTEVVKQALYEHMNNESKEPVFDPEPTYALFDLNGDGVDELFISYNNAESLGSDLYIYKDGKYIKSFFAYTGAYICLDEHLMRANWYGGGEMTKIYCMVDNELLQKDELSVSYAINEFSHNDHVITESEYNQLLDQYDAMNWIYVPDNSRLVSDLIDISKYTVNINNDANNSNNSNIYSGYKYIENAPPDMTFYDINDTPSGIVTTESTSLNLRQGPGTNYEIILYLQKGDTVEVLGKNSEWAYVKWSVWGAQQWIDYYGYVSIEFLDIGFG